MDKIFTEHDWDNEESAEQMNLSFVKQKPPKKSKKQPKTQNEQKASEPGQFVRAPPKDDEAVDGKVLASTAKGNSKKSRKRKSGESVEQLRQETEQQTENKKSKQKAKNGNPPVASQNGKAKKAPANPAAAVKEKPVLTPSKPENFRDKLVESLKGSRFRFLNEQLYKTTGDEAKKMFQQDPSAFQAYHEGYRHQIVQWSVNPLDRIIKSFNKVPGDHVVADFGCGEARLAASIQQKVYSLDLVAANSSVIACDMANTPLETNSVNVAVFCLSLMGTNLRDFLLEANRVLKVGGLLKVAEVSSRFDNVKEFIDCVQKCGFLVDNKDLSQKLFYFFNFKKVRTVDKAALKGKHFSLKPCLYKKR